MTDLLTRALACVTLFFVAACATTAPPSDPAPIAAFSQPPTIVQMRARYAGPPSQFLEVDGVQMHYRDSGSSKPVMILLPGHMGNLRMYDGWLPYLQPAYRTIGLDWPPYGLSLPDPSGVYSTPRAAELVIGFLEAKDIERAVLVGTSNGASVAAHVAAMRPDLVERLALSTFPLGRPPGREISPELAEQARLHMNNTTYRPESLFRAILRDIFHDPDKVTPELVRMYTDMNNHPGGYEAQNIYIQNNLAMYAAPDWPAIYAKIEAPTLIQWGDGGTVVPGDLAQGSVDALTNAPVVLLRYPQLGHMPMLEEPEKTARDLLAFLAGDLDDDARPPRAGLLAHQPGATPNLTPCEDSVWCGFERPEDISVLDGTTWLVVSQADADADAPLILLDSAEPSRRFGILPAEPGSFERGCDRPVALKPRGHAIATIDGKPMLAVINGGESARVEVYEVSIAATKPGLTLRECIAVPPEFALNDLVVGEDNAIYATHMFDPPRSAEAAAELRKRLERGETTGFAVRWTERNGWQKVPGTELSFANGIAIDNASRTLAVAGTYSQAAILIDLASGNSSRIVLPLQPDNITTLSDGAFLVAGHTGKPVSGIDPCRPVASAPCGFPFAVARFDSDDAPELVYTHNGSTLPGASVAVSLPNGDMLLGSAFGDRIVRLPGIFDPRPCVAGGPVPASEAALGLSQHRNNLFWRVSLPCHSSAPSKP